MIEQALSGVLMQRPEIVAEIADIVSPADFTDERASAVYSMASDAFRAGEPFDLVIAGSRLPQFAPWLAQAYDTLPINYVNYASEISGKARLRRLKYGAKVIAAGQYDDADTALYDLARLHKQESRVSRKKGSITEAVTRTREIIEKNRARGRMHGCSTGFRFLDEMYVRYVPGMMWVITGFTSAGKSAMANEMISRLHDKRVLLVSTEMTEEQVVARFVASETTCHTQSILSGQLEPENLQKVDTVLDRIAKRSFLLFDDVIDITEIESVVMQQSMRKGVDVVFIDYVQQLRCKGIPRKEWGAEIAERIQQLSKRANTCIVCLSQVSNEVGRGAVDQFEAKGAGEWAACSDVGIRLKRKESDKYALLFDMQKGRHFGTCQQELVFMANFTRIEERAQDV